MVTRVVSRVQEASIQGKMVGMLLIDVKGSFDHISRNCLSRTMERMGADGHLMRMTKSFISNSSVGLVINRQLCKEIAVEIGVP